MVEDDFLFDGGQLEQLWLNKALAFQSQGMGEAFIIVLFVCGMLVDDEQLVLVLIMRRWPDGQYEAKIELANDAHSPEVGLCDSQRELVLGLCAVQFVFDNSAILAWTLCL